MTRKTWDGLPCAYVAETEQAVKVDTGDRQLWIPKSLIANAEAFIDGDDDELQVATWFLEDSNLL